MKKFSKILCIIAAVAVMVACFAIPASAASPDASASMEYPQSLNYEVGDTVVPGWYVLKNETFYTNVDWETTTFDSFLFDVTIAGYYYPNCVFEFYNVDSFLYIYTQTDHRILVRNDVGFFYDGLKMIYVTEPRVITGVDECSFFNLNYVYVGDSLEVPGAEPEGWYNNIYDLVVKYIFGGEMNLTPGMEFSASLVATVISIVAFLLPILICVFIIRFLFAWRI